MSVALSEPVNAELEERHFVIPGIRWDAYVTINEALGDRRNPRMIYCQGRLTFMGKSRVHERLAEYLDHLVIAVASYSQIECEPSGEATYRRRQKEAGLEGDRTFHFGANAERMRGIQNYDFEEDPPPDLAIEVEVTHPADEAIAAWGRLAVPEVWRFDAATWTCSFWNRRDDGSYEQVTRSLFLSMLDPSDVVDQVRRAQEVGTSKWYLELGDWVRDVVRPRVDRGV
jgi:Uma2 family endonuclease